jgi:hypothetical protein
MHGDVILVKVQVLCSTTAYCGRMRAVYSLSIYLQEFTPFTQYYATREDEQKESVQVTKLQVSLF